MNRAWRLLHTVRYLRPVQVWGRWWFRLYRPRPDTRAAPPVRTIDVVWQPCRRPASMTAPSTFRFLGVERTLEGAGDWNHPGWPRLWLYNLHYFDDLAADDAGSRAPWHRGLMARWIADNPPAQGTGWEPYPTSLRIVNWVKWALCGNALDAAATRSLAIQARWLRRRLEHHLQGNHLWTNAKALVFAGAFFEGAESRRWLARGLSLVRRELAAQVLADGGHVERSPMYHAIVLEDLVDLLQLARCVPGLIAAGEVAGWRGTAVRMLHWLRVMTHPDGGIAFFNDAAPGVAPDHATLVAYGATQDVVDTAPAEALELLPDSGYARLQAAEAVLIADIGEIGADHLAGHAHADTLSFEFSLAGRRLLVNGGTSTYTEGEDRRRQRGTAAHNTVVIDGQDSSEVWSSFRVARRAHPHDVDHGTDADALWLRAAHDGYRRLRGRPVHRREWRLSNGRLRIVDRIEGSFDQAQAWLHLHPEWRAEVRSAETGMLVAADQRAPTVRWETGATAGIRPDCWHPGFGVDQASQAIVLPFAGTTVDFTLTWD